MPPHVTLKLTINEAQALDEFLEEAFMDANDKRFDHDTIDAAMDRVQDKVVRALDQKASQ